MRDWLSFLVNSARVRKWHDCTFDSSYQLSREAVSDIGITRPVAHIFPNLSEMEVGTSDLEPFFMGTSVRRLSLLVRHNSDDSQASELRTISVLMNVADRMPQLTELWIGYLDDDTPNYDSNILHLLQHLPALQNLTLPALCLDAAIVSALAHHKDLHTIDIDEGEPFVLYPCTQETRFMFDSSKPLPVDAFPSILNMKFSAPNLDDAASFIFQPEFPLYNLKRLFIHTRIVPPSEDVGRFIERLVTACDVLDDLRLDFHELQYRSSIHLSATASLEFRHIAPISLLKTLTSLIIRHPYPLDMNDDDVERLAAGLPNLAVLHLNPYPVITTTTEVTCLALRHLASHCPDLVNVGIYLDGNVAMTPISILPRPLSVTLTLGHSPLPVRSDSTILHYPRIARYLGSVLSESCTWGWKNDVFVPELHNYRTWLPSVTPHHDLDGYKRGWETVAALTRMIFEDRCQMRENGLAVALAETLEIWKGRLAALEIRYAEMQEALKTPAVSMSRDGR